MKRVSYFIAAKDSMSDLLAADLILALKEKIPNIVPIGLGGSAMERAGLQPANLSLAPQVSIGFLQELDLRHVIESIDRSQLRFAIVCGGMKCSTVLFEALTLRRIPIVFYGAPAVYAWTQDDWDIFKALKPRVLGFFPFEASVFERQGVAYQFVGNPLCDRMAKVSVDLDTFKIKQNSESWLLFKCPRDPVLCRLVFPTFWRLALSVAQQASEWTVVFNFARDFLDDALDLGGTTFAPFADQNIRGNIKLLFNMSHELTKLSDLVVSLGGTDSLEVALLEIPGIAVTTEPGVMDLAWPRFGCLTNALLNRLAMPELRLNQTDDLLQLIQQLLGDQEALIRQRQEFSELRSSMEGFAAENAAMAMTELIQRQARRI